MRRYAISTLLVLFVAGASLLIPGVRSQVRAIVRPEPPPQVTPLAMTLPQRTPIRQPARLIPTTRSTATLAASRTSVPAAAAPAPTATPSPMSEPSPTPGPLIINGRAYDAYIPAASKEKQAYRYSCEFDAAWVIVQTYGIDANVDDLIAAVGVDDSIEPYIKQTGSGLI